MKEIAKDVQALLSGLKTVTRQIDRLTMRADRLTRAQVAEKGKAKAKARRPRKASAIRLMPKKTGALTATDEVVGIIQRAKKGVAVPALIKKTGFEDTKVRNILTRALRQGRIERAGRGIYVAAEERRRHPRMDSLNLLWYACMDAKNRVLKEGMGRTLDLTEDGILLETHLPMNPQQRVSLCIGMKDDLMDIKGKVVYCKRRGQGKFRSGIRFTKRGEGTIRTLRRFIRAFRREKIR